MKTKADVFRIYQQILLLQVCLISLLSISCSPKISTSHVANGWARNSVNTVIFRRNSLYTFQEYQYIGFYDNNRDMILGKRKIGTSQWQLERTSYKGNAFDAHNSISLIVDQEGYLHVSWDHHNNYLRYARSISPEGLKLGEEQSMTNSLEKVVTYPEFYKLNDNELLFAYRSGESGNGDLILNKYHTPLKKWSRIQSNLIDGEGERNAYWQLTTDSKGVIHVSWVWRESADVASNHDMCYARSLDGGITWQESDGTPYDLPITLSSAEIVQRIPQKSELINQTAMTTTDSGKPIIVSYWKDALDKAPQYKIITQLEDRWKTFSLDFRTLDFSLSGVGTKAIPISRPQVVSSGNRVHVVFRDAERDNRVSVATALLDNLSEWTIIDLTTEEYESWEPTLDPIQWNNNRELHLFLQNTTQVDGEGLSNTPPSAIKVLKWQPKK
jgi:hypothetical protein